MCIPTLGHSEFVSFTSQSINRPMMKTLRENVTSHSVQPCAHK